ncbi:PREDICTED: vacuolar protein 8-like [Ipomoea nil]|uniref:vacuolar protein 8-like n=1 Tax=Ipomoea nil TaxID=35883 RepID=UPI0009008655|nr:PREDICTED: vacuolar protein 8-like [Ipomoea nil]
MLIRPPPENGFSVKPLKTHLQAESTRHGHSSPEPPTGESRIRRAIDLISTLISLTHSTKVFSVKWQLIRCKLEELLAGVSAVESCDDSGENRRLLSSVKSITATVKSCHDLARGCVDLTYSGKLLMQSDLDIVSAKLDGHIKSMAEIYARGLLKQSNAIVVSRPGPTASREDIKFYITDLLSRLKIGRAQMKKEALVAFNEAIQEDERYVKAAIEIDNFVAVLVSLLDFQEAGIHQEAAKAASLIAGFQPFRGVLIMAGIVAPLIRILESGRDELELGKDYAARCLIKVTENSDNAWAVSSHGGVTVLVKICAACDDSGGELVGLACGVLKNLVGVEEIKRFMIEDGAIPVFIRLVRMKDEVTQLSAMDLLLSMGSGDESTRQMIITEGGIRAIVTILDPISSFSSKIREVALRGIVNLCFTSPNSLTILLSLGFIDYILYFLQYGEVSVQEFALKAAFWLCKASEDAKKAMGDAGFMAELVKFLDSRSYDTREMAAETLSSMLVVPRNRKRFVQNDQNVGLILQMLDPQEKQFGNKNLLLSILKSLASSSSARKKIASSGYLKNIEKLAENEVSDAKKIVKRLHSNRFRNILSGIWGS